MTKLVWYLLHADDIYNKRKKVIRLRKEEERPKG